MGSRDRVGHTREAHVSSIRRAVQTQHRSESDTATNRASRCLIGNIVLNYHHDCTSLRLCWIRDDYQKQMYNTSSCYPFVELCAVSQRRSVPTTSGARDILSRPGPLSRERAASESASVPYVNDRDKSFIIFVRITTWMSYVHNIIRQKSNWNEEYITQNNRWRYISCFIFSLSTYSFQRALNVFYDQTFFSSELALWILYWWPGRESFTAWCKNTETAHPTEDRLLLENRFQLRTP